MARSSKDSSNPGSSGFLFGSDAAEPEVDQLTSESSEPRPAKAKKRRSSAKRAKEEQSQEPVETTPTFILFDEQPEPDSSPAPVEEIISEEKDVPEDTVPTQENEEVSQESPAETSNMETITQEKTDVVVPVVPQKLESETDQEEFVPSSETKPVDNTLQGETASLQDNPAQGEIPEETAAIQTAEEIEPPISRPVSESTRTSSSRKPSAYQVVARRYRPQAFDELIGQESVARALTNAIETNRVGHAYLFTGARGVGKTSCARIFAKALNCIEGPTTHPCLKCDSCIGVSIGEDVDVIEIDGASNRGVDEIRQLRQNATIAPSRSRYKIYIIDEVHMLTREAFNALLKTLEEPPARVKFIFCTTEPNKIPVTILSRCQRFDFNSINGVSIAQRLEQIAKQEGAEAEDGVFDILARRANGSMRDAQSLLEQLLSFAPNHITQTDVHNMLGSVDDGKIFSLLNATVDGDSQTVFETLGAASRQGVDFGALVEQTFGVYRDLMIVASGCGPKELAYSPVARFAELKKIASEFGMRRILASLQILDQTIQRMRYSAQTRILAELAFARLCRLDAFQTIESLINQLKSGELPKVELNVFRSDSQTVQEDDKKKTNLELNPAPTSQTVDRDSCITNVPESVPFQKTTSPVVALASEPDGSQTATSVGAPAIESQPVILQQVQDNCADWLSLPQSELASLWTNATSSGIVLPTHASAFFEIRPETPSTFTVVFPAGCQMQRDYCENERAAIESRISGQLGGSVVLRLIVDPTIHEPASKENVRTPLPANGQDLHRHDAFINVGSDAGNTIAKPTKVVDFQELHRQVENSEVAQQIQELFEAELSEVKPPAPPAKKLRRWGHSDD